LCCLRGVEEKLRGALSEALRLKRGPKSAPTPLNNCNRGPRMATVAIS
jgi:hypothetical protein